MYDEDHEIGNFQFSHSGVRLGMQHLCRENNFPAHLEKPREHQHDGFEINSRKVNALGGIASERGGHERPLYRCDAVTAPPPDRFARSHSSFGFPPFFFFDIILISE